jgi:hypothetical protein
MSAYFGFRERRRPWRWALAVGIPLLNIVIQGNFGSLIALAFAFAGAHVGALVGRSMRHPSVADSAE